MHANTGDIGASSPSNNKTFRVNLQVQLGRFVLWQYYYHTFVTEGGQVEDDGLQEADQYTRSSSPWRVVMLCRNQSKVLMSDACLVGSLRKYLGLALDLLCSHLLNKRLQEQMC